MTTNTTPAREQLDHSTLLGLYRQLFTIRRFEERTAELFKAGKVYGIAMFDHPQNPRHPTWWHVRDYGLFAANPFGQHDFESTREKRLPAHTGDFTIPAGGNATFRWRIYFHMGDEKTARVAEHFAAYAAEK